MTTIVVGQAEAAPQAPAVGAINTDVHHYVADGIALVLPHITRSWRSVFEMRETRIGGGGPPGSDPMFATRERVRPPVKGVDRLWRTQEPKRLEGCSKVV
jgi:hypothetical protein